VKKEAFFKTKKNPKSKFFLLLKYERIKETAEIIAETILF
jgi:hypothetical protein